MQKALFFSLSLLASSLASANETGHWSYNGETGPENWAKLTPENTPCSGKNQSPINLTGFIEAELPSIWFSYRDGGKEVLNNGHTVQVNYEEGSTIKLDNSTFTLKQYHFHAPSENLIDGKSYPMETHLVHADPDGNLAVIALMFEEGEANPELEKVWAQLPVTEGSAVPLKETVDVSGLLPRDREYYRFNGSLTTPPCTEGVRWLVMKEPVTASQEQITKFALVMRHPNNRPVQAVNARPVLQ